MQIHMGSSMTGSPGTDGQHTLHVRPLSEYFQRKKTGQQVRSKSTDLTCRLSRVLFGARLFTRAHKLSS